MRWVLVALGLGAVLGTGCGASFNDTFIGCRDDSECDSDQVCFTDGCGNPGKNIVVEVAANPKSGLYEQDLPVDELHNPQPLVLQDPARLQGQLRVHGEGASGYYTGQVTLQLTGESLRIPDVVRYHTSTFLPNAGSYSLLVGEGHYTVTLMAADPAQPPITTTQDVQAGPAHTLDFTLPAASELVRLSGTVLRLDSTPVRADLAVQALDDQQRPLSQRATVDGDTGQFTLTLTRADAQRTTVVLQVVPTAADALVPQKLFSVDPSEALSQPLLMGDYGEKVILTGRALDSSGQPVSQAVVSLAGQVGGGGSYHSAKALTQEDGSFTLDTLPSATDSVMTLSVIPPPGSDAGYTQRYISVPRVSTSRTPDVVCGQRVKVSGTLQKPSDSLPAAGVRVVAEPLEELPGLPMPTSTFEALHPTDDMGHFELSLDPGRYRIDFLPSEDLPRVSRIVTVRPGDTSGPPNPLELSIFTLSKGRRVSGQVSFSGQQLVQPAVPYASVRFFRVVDVEGKSSALLLAQTLADQSGNYSATLPTR